MKIIIFDDLTTDEKEKIKRMANKLIYQKSKTMEISDAEKQTIIEQTKQLGLAIYNRVENIEDVLYCQKKEDR